MDANSLLNFYRKAINLRKTLPVVRHGIYKEHFCRSKKVYTYTRESEEEKLLVICSFTDEKVKVRIPKGFELSKAKLLLQNYEECDSAILKPYETRVYIIKE